MEVLKPASEIEPGDVLFVPGAELHDDLAGVEFRIKVERVETTDNGYVDVRCRDVEGDEESIWWKPEEVVKFHQSSPNPSKIQRFYPDAGWLK